MLSEPAKQLLLDIANSEFTVKGKDLSETPEGEDPRKVEGQITRQDLIHLMQSRIKKIGKVARPPSSSLRLLVKFKLIEKLENIEVYKKKSNVGEPEWKLDTDSFKAYKVTESGKIAARRVKINPD
jgi:hypothetical protein